MTLVEYVWNWIKSCKTLKSTIDKITFCIMNQLYFIGFCLLTLLFNKFISATNNEVTRVYNIIDTLKSAKFFKAARNR